MTTEEITALAREYAEEFYKVRGGLDLMADEAENVIRFLFRRYALVEKSKLKEEYRKVQKQMIEGDELGIHVLFIHGKIKKDLLESLFPEIAKEVEE